MKTLPMALIALLATSAHADNFRCGKWIATPDMSVAELLAKCGDPDKRESRTEDVYSRGVNGTYRSGSVTIQTWVYQRGSSAAPMVVTIVDGSIESIERRQ